MEDFRKLRDLLNSRERRQALLMILMVLGMALLDVAGVASIMPFMAVLADPNLIQSNVALAYVFKEIGFQSESSFLLFLGVAVFVLFIFSILFKALTTYVQLRFSLMREYSFGKRLIENYLHQPYTWFLDRHSADLSKTVLSEVSQVIHGSLIPMMTALTQGVVAMSIIILLVVVDPWLALGMGVLLGGAILGISKLFKGFLTQIGEERTSANLGRFTAVGEIFGAFKEVKMRGMENIFIGRFGAPAKKFASRQAAASALTQIPAFAFEGVAFGAMFIVIFYLMLIGHGLETALPIITLYAFASYRLMPAIKQIHGSITQLSYYRPALNDLHTDMTSQRCSAPTDKNKQQFEFNERIELDNLFYTYPNAPEPSLRGLSLGMSKRSVVGLVGTTGSGKTTTVDVILGLLEPQQGALKVDGVTIGPNNRRAWQHMIGYVPQQIYLSDDTVAANIAFGVDSAEIDESAVERAARIANLHDFVVKELPKGYASKIGELGVRLSGGQRQRIGIARALYNDPQVLILDEATSALDNITEKAFMKAIHNLSNDITLILIAHRLSTVRECDSIYLLDGGRVEACGTYDELKLSNSTFKELSENSK